MSTAIRSGGRKRYAAARLPANPGVKPVNGGSPGGLRLDQSSVLTAEESRTARALVNSELPALTPLPFGGVLQEVAPQLRQLERIRVGLNGAATTYEWGPWLEAVNQNPYQYYLRQQQAAAQVPVLGIDPAAAQNSVWGRVVLALTSLDYSSRFGGSIRVTLTPEEDYGIEVTRRQGAGNPDLYVNLEKWLLHLWIQPTRQMFNQPVTVNQIGTRLFTELEATEYEAYEMSGGRLIPATPPEAEVNALLGQAAADAQNRLITLAKFALGYVHETELGAFDAQGDAVEEIFLSDGMCALQTRQKVAHVRVRMNTHYFGTGSLEGPFDDDAEVTAEPWLILRDPVLVLSSVRKSKYIGSGSSTGYLTFDYLPLDKAGTIEATAFASWTENDPVSDDFGGSLGFVFDVTFDRAQLEADAAANNLGRIGSTLFGVQNDVLEDGVSYAVELEFELVKL